MSALKYNIGQTVKKDADNDITTVLANIMRENPQISKEEAWSKAKQDLLANNPFVPPKDGHCPVNELPTELLAYIFRVGMLMQQEEVMEGGEGQEDEDEDAQAFKGVLDSVWEDGESEEDEEEGEKEGGEKKIKMKKTMLVDVNDADIAEDDGDQEWEDEGSEDDSEDFEDEEDEMELPFQVLVSHVCKHWREVALEAPMLWTTMNFTVPARFDQWRAYLDRAKSMPLDIYINATIPDGWQEVDHPDHPDYVVEPDMDEDEDEDEEGHGQCCGGPHDHHAHSKSKKALKGEKAPKGEKQGEGEEEEGDNKPNVPFFSTKQIVEIVDLVCPIVSQWRLFEFSASEYNYVHLLLSRLQELPSAPILEVFQLYHYEDCEEYDAFSPAELGTPFLPFHGNAPNLKDVALWGVHLDWDRSLSFLTGLHDLELAYHARDVRPSWATFCSIISSSPDIHTLSLCLSGPAGSGSDEEWSATPFEIPSLRDLVLCYHDPAYASALVQHLSTPNVHSLALDYDEQDYTDFARQLTVPVKGRTKSLLAGLQHLKIAGLPCSERVVDEVYAQLAELKTLNLDCDGMEEEVFFERLAYPSSPYVFEVLGADGAAVAGPSSSNTSPVGTGASTPVPKIHCPQLETLTTTGIEGARIKEFVALRIKAGHPIKKVCMSDQDDIEEEDEGWLKRNLEALEFFELSEDEEEFVDVDEEGLVDVDDEDAMDTDD